VSGTGLITGNTTIGTGTGDRIFDINGGTGGLIRFLHSSIERFRLYSYSSFGSAEYDFTIANQQYLSTETPVFRIDGGNNNIILNPTNGSTGIGTASPNASALLDVSSTTKGFLPPRMTGAQAEAIGTPAAGLLVYSTDGSGATITSLGWWGYNGATWIQLG
jgi:hypothetical protein